MIECENVCGELTTVRGPAGNPAASGLVASTILISVWLTEVAPFAARNPQASSFEASHSMAGIATNLNLLTLIAPPAGSAISTVPEPSDDDWRISTLPSAVDPSSGTAVPVVSSTSYPRLKTCSYTAWSPAKVSGPGSFPTSRITSRVPTTTLTGADTTLMPLAAVTLAVR